MRAWPCFVWPCQQLWSSMAWSFERLDDSVGAMVSQGTVAFACVLGPICCDDADLLVCRDLAAQVGQNCCIANVVPHGVISLLVKLFLVNPQADLASVMPF